MHYRAFGTLFPVSFNHAFVSLFVSTDNCKKLGLVFENAVGIVEIINSRSVQLQVSKIHEDECVCSVSHVMPNCG